jgi:hypothetical protein
MSDDPLRLRIIDKMKVAVAAIRTANGYQTDIGENVFAAIKPNQIDNWITVIPQPSQFARAVYGESEQVFPIRFEASISFDEGVDGSKVYQVAEKALADIIQCVTAIFWGKLDPAIEDFYPTEGGVESYPEPREDFVGVYCIINFVFKHLVNDVYHQS